MKQVLTIAGSDCSGGAGIQADLKTFLAHGVYGMSAITALTAQNTMGVTQIMEVTPEFLQAQFEAIWSDIPPHAVKIGMVASKSLIEIIGKSLDHYQAKNVVVDPVMIATSGAALIEQDAMDSLCKVLLPQARVITPNLKEAEALVGFDIQNQLDMEKAGEVLSKTYGTSVIIKGGHLTDRADDLLWEDGKPYWFPGKRIKTQNTHGTGCTLSSALAANLALGMDLQKGFELAKAYVAGALEDGMDLGKGNGPLNHGYRQYPTV